MKKSFENEIDIGDIKNYFFSKLEEEKIPYSDFKMKASLVYKAYYFFEMHIGKKKHFALLDAVDSELLLEDKDIVECILKKKVFDLDELLSREEYRFFNAKVFDPKYKEDKAMQLLEYKLKYFFDEKPFIASLQLYYLPFFNACIEIDNKKFNLSFFASSKNSLKQIDSLSFKDLTKKEDSWENAFYSLMKDIKKPEKLLNYIGELFLSIFKIFFLIIAWFFKEPYADVKIILFFLVIVFILVLVL